MQRWIQKFCSALGLVLGLVLMLVAGASVQAEPAPRQRAGGLPYEVLGTEVHEVEDVVRKRIYPLFVSLPPDYAANPRRRYPVVYVTDADYGFPMLRLIGRRMNVEGPRIEDFILVGLGYATGEDGMTSRRRDYTPTPRGPSGAPPGARHGESRQYVAHLRDTVLPFVDARWRTDPARRVYVGHSYGGLLGAEMLLSEPGLFSGYVLGSPSLWFDKRHLLRELPARLQKAPPLRARVYLYVGELEALRRGEAGYQQQVDMVADNETLAAHLRARRDPGLALRSDVLRDEDHLSVAPRGFTRGLLHVLPHRPAAAP